MGSRVGENVRIKATGFEGRLGIVDYVEQKAESFRGWNYSVLVLDDKATTGSTGEFYCFSRDELEFLDGPEDRNSGADLVAINIAKAQDRYVAYQYDLSTYVVYDQMDECDICICSDCDSVGLPELRARMIVEALNRSVADPRCGR